MDRLARVTEKKLTDLLMQDANFANRLTRGIVENYYFKFPHRFIHLEDALGRPIACGNYLMLDDDGVQSVFRNNSLADCGEFRRILDNSNDQSLNAHILTVVIDKEYRKKSLIFKLLGILRNRHPNLKTISWVRPGLKEMVLFNQYMEAINV